MPATRLIMISGNKNCSTMPTVEPNTFCGAKDGGTVIPYSHISIAVEGNGGVRST